MKQKSVFVCGECGYETPRWMGRCPQCGSWNTIVEEERVSLKAPSAPMKAVPLKDVSAQAGSRTSTGIDELDRVLGGGLTSGMTVLIGGSPGIGKSTLLLQCADNLSRVGPVLYASGEESRHQIRLRADRLGLGGEVLLLCENAVESILSEAEGRKAALRPWASARMGSTAFSHSSSTSPPRPSRSARRRIWCRLSSPEA